MNFKKIVVPALVACVALLSASQAFAEALTLDEAIAKAAGDSPSVLARAAGTDKAKAAVDGAEAKLMPNLIFSETYVRTDNPVGVFAAKLNQGKFTAADFAVPRLNNPKSINNWITRVELKMPIIHSGVNWAGRRAAIEGKNAAEHMEDFERASVTLTTKKLYFAAVALSRQRRALDEGIGKLRSLENSYQLMEAPTSASTTSYLVAKSVRENLEANVVKVDCERERILRDLNALLGNMPDAELTLTDPLPPVASAAGIDNVQTRSDIEASASSVRATDAERKAALRRWGPNVDFFGAYDVFTGNFKDAKGSYEVGARLSWPVFDWGRHSAIRMSRARHAQAKHMHRAAALRAKAQLQTAESNVRSCMKRYRIVSKAFESARQALGQSTTRYREGTLPLMDYSQAIQNWVEMKTNLIENHLGVSTAVAEYDFQRGSV